MNYNCYSGRFKSALRNILAKCSLKRTQFTYDYNLSFKKKYKTNSSMLQLFDIFLNDILIFVNKNFDKA